MPRGGIIGLRKMGDEGPRRIVATLTTLPRRYPVLLETLKSLRAQTLPPAAIYLAVPKRSRRLALDYPPPPAEVSALCTVVPLETDYGPLSKLYGALSAESDPATCVVSCDDDAEYPPTLFERLVGLSERHPRAALCGTGALLRRGLLFASIVSSLPEARWSNGLSGFRVGREGRRVDLVFGVAGVLYRRGFFPPPAEIGAFFRLAEADEDLYRNDDVVVSGYLGRQGVERRLFCDIPGPRLLGGGDALSANVPRMLASLHRALGKAEALGLFPGMEPMDPDEPLLWKVVLGLVAVALLAAASALLYLRL